MDHLINGLSSVYRPIQRNKFQFLTCLVFSFVLALILSFTLGESFSWSDRRLRGPPRRVKRQTTQAQDGYKEPFPNRPRIQTKNGHLIIEASQDKNIDFKTSGSRGTITINGIKLDQLLNVSKALEKTLQQSSSKNQSKQSKTSDPYEMILENIYLSDGKLLNLERTVDLLSERLIELSKRLIKGSRQISKAVQQVNKIGRQQESLLEKLKRNECMNNETGRLVCKNGATCIDTFNGFNCICPPNYEGPTCEQDVDECARFHNTDLGCQNGAKCINLVGSYRCECPPQYHGVHCTEQHDDCSLSSSRSMCGYGKCINLPRTVSNQASFECICDQGWTTDGRNSPCVIDINECLVGQSYSTGLNISSDSSAPWSNSLMAAYPCSQNPYVECINLPGSFQCGPCPSGYTGNGRVCRDIDECATNNGGCSTSPAVECINTPGSRQCGSCPAGYAGDGVTCTPAVACSLQPNGGCHPMAKCMDLPGASSNSRLCVCRYPFTGDGVGPDGCKNSQPGASNSSTNASIPYPFQLKQDDCHPNPCSSGSECLLTETSYECICRPGRIGRLCEIIQLKCGGEFFVSRGKLKFPFPGSFNEALKRPARQESKATDQHYDCYWRLSVASNMSVQLVFNELSNKVNPAKRIQMYLANSTDGPAPTCTESLDIRERLDSDDTNMVLTDSQPSSRLVARFCPDARGGKISSVTNKKPIIISTGSNSAELEYTFSETRTQFGEPSLAFDLNWTSVDPPCGGELPILETGSISSPNFPEFYKPGIECRYLIRVPYSHRVRLQFGELNLLTGRPHSSSCSDSLTIIDGAIGPDRPVLFKHCANNSTLMGKSQTLPAIISSGSIVEVVLISRPGSTTPLMRPKQKRGFYLTYASESTTPGCGGLFSQKSATIRSIDYEPSSMDANQRDNSMLALQMSRYFESKDSNSMYQPDQSLISSMFDFVIRDESPTVSGSNGSSAGPMRRPRWFKTRCEYEIRPMNQSRDHKISLDWLDLPGEPVTEANAMSQWARRLRCNRARLTVYDGNPLDSSNRTEIARFCSGDRYNSSSLLLMPVTSSGHVLLLVYESRQSLDDTSNDMPPSGNAGSGSGFKLHYSTVCSAVYDQQSGEILVEISPEVPECIYHIMLPPNNTISLFVQPKTMDALNPVDGNCPAQAIFMDGAIQNSRLALIGVERQLKSYKFERTTELVHGNLSSRAGDSVVNDSMSTPKDDQDAIQVEVVPNSYWQYTWSPVHDIKEFEVCRLQYLDFDSIWNHMSLMFRMNQQQMLLDYKPKSQRLLVRYQAEPACGGIINEPREGSFVLESTKRVAGMEFYPLTSSRYDQLHQQEFTNPCAWILRAKSNQVINIEFEAPMGEINKRYNEWLNWKKTHNASALFNCSQVFQESIELYEPSLNRTRLLCLRDLFVDNSTTKWSTNSNIVYLRLHNTTDPSNSTSNLTWPSRRPLLVGNHVLTTRYKFASVTNRTLCGGKLLHDSGVITSPRYPFNYPPSSNCTWIIQTNPGQQIRMNFSRFDLERQADCLFDYLELRNGQSDQSPLIGRFCNQDLQNQTIVAHSNTVLLTFKSDGHLSKQGFEISYDGALTGCGGKLKTANGQIDSPNYPQPYAHNSSCEWTIETGQSNRLELTFIDLDLAENSSFCQPDGLKTDYLEVIDYKEDNSTRSLAKLCSLKELKDGAIRSTRNKMSIVYRSQTLDNSRGFRLTYRTICNGPIELTGSNGVIESPGYPNDYSPHLKCHWIIRAPPRTNLTLNITDLDIEESINQSMEFVKRSRTKPICTADFLEIWARHSPISSLDPPQVNSTNLEKGAHLVQTLCGTVDRWTTNGSQPQLLFSLDADVANVKFESDRSIETRGFRLEWQSKS